MRDKVYDVVIVGAGPAGLTAGIFAQNKGLRALVTEGSRFGGQLRSVYPSKPVYDYPGYTGIEAGKLADRMVRQVVEGGVPPVEETPVKEVVRSDGDDFLITTSASRYCARSVIIACGMGLFTPRTLGIPGESSLKNKWVFYTIDDIAGWKQCKIAVIGGGNSALDNALLLHENGCEVVVIHRLDELQADQGTVEKLKRLQT